MKEDESIKMIIDILSGYVHSDLIKILSQRIYNNVVKISEDEIKAGWIELLYRTRNDSNLNS